MNDIKQNKWKNQACMIGCNFKCRKYTNLYKISTTDNIILVNLKDYKFKFNFCPLCLTEYKYKNKNKSIDYSIRVDSRCGHYICNNCYKHNNNYKTISSTNYNYIYIYDLIGKCSKCKVHSDEINGPIFFFSYIKKKGFCPDCVNNIIKQTPWYICVSKFIFNFLNILNSI